MTRGALALAAVPFLLAPVPSPQPSRQAARLPGCQAAQLRGSVLSPNGLAGSVEYDVELVNRSRRTCALPGRPASLAGITAGGAAQALAVRWLAAGSPYVGDQPAVLVPGGRGELALLVGTCPTTPPGPTYRRLLVGLHGGGRVGVRAASPITTACGAAATGYALVAGGPGEYGLQARLAPSFALRPSQRLLAYTVTLRNPTGRAVRFGRCPSFTESLTVQRTRGIHELPDRRVALRSYRLNCGHGNRTIPAHGARRYAMRLPLSRQPRGEIGGTLTWRLDLVAGTGPEARSYWCAPCASTPAKPGVKQTAWQTTPSPS